MNMVLGNGARLYVDHAHPEYSSPETTNPFDAVLWDQAGDHVALAAVRRIEARPGCPPVHLYKNNTDNKSVSYGAHENYLMPRSVPFETIAAGLIPFFVTRQVICASGRVGRGMLGQYPGFQVSPARRLLRGARSDWRPPSAAPSSTPATSRTHTGRNTAGCT